jgi:hypothetical protein
MDKPTLFNKEFQKQQSEKYSYQHIHTGEYCTFEAYVAEYILIRRSEKLNSGTLPYKFWTKGCKEHWTWLKQLNAARVLGKKYGEKTLLSFLKSKDFDKFLLIGLQNGRGRGWKVNPAIIPLLEKYKETIEDQEKKELESKVLEIPKGDVKRKTFGSNKLNKLRSLENG